MSEKPPFDTVRAAFFLVAGVIATYCVLCIAAMVHCWVNYELVAKLERRRVRHERQVLRPAQCRLVSGTGICRRVLSQAIANVNVRSSSLISCQLQRQFVGGIDQLDHLVEVLAGAYDAFGPA